MDEFVLSKRSLDDRYNSDAVMPIIVRSTEHQSDVHIAEVWETRFEMKMGVQSKKEYKEIFTDELSWEDHHPKWSSERVSGTQMWEVDLSALFDVILLFSERDVDVTVADEVLESYRNEFLEK